MKKFVNYIKGVNARLHLKYKCPRCKIRDTGDIYNKGECHWEKEWASGNYDIPVNMGLVNYIRVFLLGQKINYKQVYWKHMDFDERILKVGVWTIVIIGIVLLFV